MMILHAHNSFTENGKSKVKVKSIQAQETTIIGETNTCRIVHLRNCPNATKCALQDSEPSISSTRETDGTGILSVVKIAEMNTININLQIVEK